MRVDVFSCSIAGMANIQSAKKAARHALKRRTYNARRKKAMKQAVKSVLDAKTAPKPEAVALSYKAIDKAAKNGVIKKNTAARMKSRVARAAKK